LKSAVVTGGAGFIGSHLTQRLLSEGWKVYVIDNLSTGFESNIPEGAEFLFLDLSKDDFIHGLPDENIDVVFHLAAQSSGEISFEDPDYDLKTNVLSTLLLLKWCEEKNIKRFIYASSMSIYGDQEYIPVKEAVTIRPKSFYGVGKMASERYMDIYHLKGIQTTAYRLFNVYGPGQNMENLKQGMVSIFLAYLHQRKDILIKGHLDRFRDLIYIDDVVDSFMYTLDNHVAYGKSYNVGTGIKTTVEQLIHTMISIYGDNPDTYPISVTDGTPGDQFGIYADITKIQNEIGWSPIVTLKNGLKKMIAWVKES
jgi:UDP-glucose 4-epimerase